MASVAPERTTASILPGFWPGLGSLALAARVEALVLRDDRPFSPADGLHRGRIRTAAGETWLTLPLRATPPGSPLGAVGLAAPEAWAPRMMRVIEQAFGDAPFLEHYRCDLARILFHGWSRLVDLNHEMLRFLLHAYCLPTQLLRASTLEGTLPSDIQSSVSDPAALEVLFWRGPAAQELLGAVPQPRPRRSGASPASPSATL